MAPQSAVNNHGCICATSKLLSRGFMRLRLFLLQLLIFLVNYPKHLFGHLVAAVVTLTCTHFGNLRAIYYCLNHAIAGSVIVLYAATRIAHDTKCSVND
jgi:hypothetical protein